MKLPELIDYLTSPRKLKALCQAEGISKDDIEDGEVTIYMADSLSMESDVRMFSQEEAGDATEFEKDGVRYKYLLEVDLAIDLLKDIKELGGSALEKAERVLHYAIYDA